MAINVLVIPEDFRKDQYVLKPIVERMMRFLGLNARVVVCADPLLGGIGEAMKWARLAEILDRYPMVHLFLLIVDRDSVPNRRDALDALEEKATEHLARDDRFFLGENAWQEIEVWVLAGQTDLPGEWVWNDVLTERDSKERYYDEYARVRGVAMSAYEGRELLAREAAKNYQRIRVLCKEDVAALEKRVSAIFAR